MHRELGFNTILYLKKISSLRECDTMSHLEEFQTNHTYLFKLICENVFVLKFIDLFTHDLISILTREKCYVKKQ